MHTTFAISVGNTRTQTGIIAAETISDVMYSPAGSIEPLVELATAWWKDGGKEHNGSVLLASVNPEVSTKIESVLRDQLGTEVYVLERDLPIPIGRDLDPETIVGVDRLLCAAAAWNKTKQACVIVDAGTAVTVDFVDGEGVFHGGAILPGATMQLESLASGTNLLDAVEFQVPDEEAFGRSTAAAMQRGVYHGIRGGVWRIIEVFASAYGGYPTVLATGGDATTLFGDDELITAIVPDLAINGIAVAARHASATDADSES